MTLNAGSAVGTFASSSVGTGITVNVSGLTLKGGATALNYTRSPSPSTTANITAVTLTVTGITANNKPLRQNNGRHPEHGERRHFVGVLAGGHGDRDPQHGLGCRHVCLLKCRHGNHR